MKPQLTLVALCLAVASHADLTLQEALNQAQNYRPAVQAARLNVDQAKQAALALGAFPPTQIGVGLSTRADLGATDDDLFISQSLDIFGRSSANRRLGEAGVQLAEANLRQTLLEVQGEVVVRYFEAATALQLKESADNIVFIADSLLNATKRRFEEGKIPEIQVTRASIEHDRSIQTALLRTSQLKASLTRLAGALGTKGLPENPSTEVNLGELKEYDLNLRPDILALQAELNESQAEKLIAQRSTLPELELVGLRSPWRDQPTHFGARLQLTWSLYDFGKRKHETASADKKAASIQQQITDLLHVSESEISAIQSELESAYQRINSYRSLLQSNRTLVEKTQLGFDEGVGTLIDVLEATRSLREIEQELTEAQLAANLASAALYEATGTLIEVTK